VIARDNRTLGTFDSLLKDKGFETVQLSDAGRRTGEFREYAFQQCTGPKAWSLWP
jgi:hypothetical protein